MYFDFELEKTFVVKSEINFKWLQNHDKNYFVFSGKIFVNGEEKTTKFSPLSRNSVVTFITDETTHDKPRVTIEINEHSVTFDWLVGTEAVEGLPGAIKSADEKPSFYFGINFTKSGWKIAVE